jgi:phytoene dehydrogenase-like protein
MVKEYDAIIIGGGPNGLTVASYLAKAGQKILILDRFYEMGGGMATEQCGIGGFYWNTHVLYNMMVDYAPPYLDFATEFTRLKWLYPQPAVAMPFHDGRWLLLYNDIEKSAKSIAQFSTKDAESYRQMRHKYAEYMKEFLAPATYISPVPALMQVPKMEAQPLGKEISELSPKSPREIIEGLFESDQVRACMIYLACHWGLEPDVEGVGYLVPLMLDRHHNNAMCVGGSHQVTGQFNKVILANHGEQLTSVIPKRIIVEKGIATGIELDDGAILKSKVVISTIDPHQTFFDLVGKDKLPEDFVESIDNYKWDKWSLLGMHLGLFDAPDFTAAASNPDINKAFMYIFGFETYQDVLNHFNEIRQSKMPAKPGFYCCFPSVHDRLQVMRPGRHTASLTEDMPFKLNGNAENWWDREMKLNRLKACLKVMSRYAPNMTYENVMGEYISSPLDISHKYRNMKDGSYKVGAYLPLQLGYNRPNAECSDGRTPVKNLYLCGASIHPGAFANFGPGYLGANVIAEDQGIKKWWHEPDYVAKCREKYY